MKKNFLKNEHDRRITMSDLTEEDIRRFNNKPRALRVQYLRPSTTENGYDKFEITYMKGKKLHYREIYGRDMQDALNRFATYLRHKDTPPTYALTFSIIGVALIILTLSGIVVMGWNLVFLIIPGLLATLMMVVGHMEDVNTKKVLRGEV